MSFCLAGGHCLSPASTAAAARISAGSHTAQASGQPLAVSKFCWSRAGIEAELELTLSLAGRTSSSHGQSAAPQLAAVLNRDMTQMRTTFVGLSAVSVAMITLWFTAPSNCWSARDALPLLPGSSTSDELHINLSLPDVQP